MLDNILYTIFHLIDEFTSLDFLLRYCVIISNFFIIIVILIVKRSGKSGATEDNTAKKNILFVTAHPDDEAMFFVPTIVDLQKIYNLHLLCFSNGNADGLGATREKELLECAKYLNFQKVEIINHEKIQDGMQQNWDRSLLSEIIIEKMKSLDTNAVLTFDQNGVSGHPNHKALNGAIKNLIENEEYSKYIEEKGIKFFVNKDVNIVRKYLGIFDFFCCLFDDHTMVNLSLWKSYKAMKIHYSQFVWYRRLFVIFSRYTYINTLKVLN